MPSSRHSDGNSGSDANGSGRVTIGKIVRAYPLTSLQEGMLVESLRRPGSEVYQGRCSALLEGPLDLDRYREAWNLAARRHEAFRTFFAWENRPEPLQVVRESVPIEIPLVDWSSASPSEQDERWADRGRWHADLSIAMDSAPMMRWELIRVAPERHHLLWHVHHAVLDGWSGFLVLKEVLEDYHALGRGEVVSRPDPPSYARFVHWIRERDPAPSEHYWRSELAGFTDPTPLPSPIRPEHGSGGRASHMLALSGSESDALAEVARRLKVTRNTLVVAAWSTLLSRYSGERDVVFGVTVSERPPVIEGIEQAAGLYLNTIPARVRVPDTDVAGWVGTLQRSLAAGREHSAPGLAQIQRWSEVPDRRLFETLVVFESFPPSISAPRGAGELDMRDATITGPSDLPLALLVFPGDTLELHLVRDTGRVTAEHAVALLAQVRALLAGIAQSSQESPRDLPLLSADERRTVLEHWSSGPPLEVAPTDVLSRIQEHAERSPEAVAVTAPDGALSYGQLIGYAEELASHVRDAVGEGDAVVGVLGARSRWFPVAVVAALSANLPYVVLDPEEPADRLRMKLGRVAVLLASEDTPGGPLQSLPTIRLGDDAGPGGARSPEEDRPVAPHGSLDGAAYVVYTSGSTGAPKGVVVGRGELAYSNGVRDLVYGDPPTAFLLLSPLSVDSAVAGLYWTLTGGGTLVLPRARIEQDPDGLAQLLTREAVTHTLMVPSLYRTLLEHIDPDVLGGLDAVIVAGESCPDGVPILHHALIPGVRLFNEYGPSEATVWCSVEEIPGDGDGPVTIGRPIPGARLYVLDESMASGAGRFVGQLYIGGPGVTRGYLGLERETDERFLANPFHGGRMYATGDLAAWTCDGRLRFLGRSDEQVKIRGHRIELAEIERVLESHPSVREAAVTVETPGADDEEDLATALAELSADVAERLLQAATRKA